MRYLSLTHSSTVCDNTVPETTGVDDTISLSRKQLSFLLTFFSKPDNHVLASTAETVSP